MAKIAPPAKKKPAPLPPGKPKLGPLHGGKAPLYMLAQVPFNDTEGVALNTPMIQIMDDGGNTQVLTKTLKDLGLFQFMKEPSRHCLEIGCGSGYMLEALMKSGDGSYYGIEPILSEANKARARISPLLPKSEKAAKHVVAGPLEKASFPAGFFDVIYSYHVFEHLENPLLMLEKARHWLKPGGTLVIICPNAEGALPRKDLSQWRQSLPSHRWLPGVSTVRRALLEYRFVIRREFTYGGHPSPRTLWQDLANFTYKLRGLGDVMVFAASPEPS